MGKLENFLQSYSGAHGVVPLQLTSTTFNFTIFCLFLTPFCLILFGLVASEDPDRFDYHLVKFEPQ